jgi:alkylated DNA repair dioxygenase AlkB
MGMHSDDEPELGRNPVIASVSFGAERTFILRHKQTKQTVKLGLSSGSMLLMRGTTQHFWLHGINKSARVTGPRVNLTFRFIC